MSDRERPGCYQCGDEDIEEIQARRKAEIQEYARRDQAEADAALVGVPLTNTYSSDLDLQEIPDDQEVPAVVNEHEVPANSSADLTVDATAQSAEENGSPATAESVTAVEDENDDEEAPKAKRKAPRKATD